MKQPRRSIAVLLSLLMLSLALAACGSPRAAAPTQAPPTPEPSPTPPPIPTDLPVEDNAAPQPEADETDAAETSEEPPPPATNAGVIVYGSSKTGSLALHVLSGTGYYSTPLEIEGEGIEEIAWPDVSPDGSQIAFVAIGDRRSLASDGIFIAPAGGGEAERLVDEGLHPRWSPDGTQIAYTCNGGTDICVIDVGGGEETNLTEDSAGVDMYPAWTPDGEIVFMSNRGETDQAAHDIWIMDAEGSDARNLTDHNADDGYPSVSPDGTRIAFVSNRNFDDSPEIFVLEPATGLVRQVTVDELWNQAPVWSPDGTTLLFAAADSTGSVNLYTIEDRAVASTQLTQNPAEDGGLRLGHAWLPAPVELAEPVREAVYDITVELPAGSQSQEGRIVFAADSTGCPACLETGIYVVDLDGENLERLPIEGRFPEWGPNYETIAFTVDGELFVANADGSDETPVSLGFQSLGAIDWNASGDAVVADCEVEGGHQICVVDIQRALVSTLDGALPDEPAYPSWWLNDIVAGTQVLNRSGGLVDTLPAPGRVSPDGRRIATISNRQVAIVDVGGGNPTVLAEGPATKGFPVWSPDGERVLYTVAPGDGGLYLNIARVDGGAAYRLVPEPIAAGPSARPERIETFLGYSWSQ